MQEKEFDIGGAKLKMTTWDGGSFKPDMSLDFIKHSPDPYYGDTETSLEIAPATAAKMIEFLSDYIEAACRHAANKAIEELNK